MEVRFAYDGDAFYVGARMWARNAKEIQAPLGRRDNTDQAEHILIALDTFLDRRTSVVLGVTAAGVRLDRYHGTDNEDSFDAGFDLVWGTRTSIDSEGWTAEIWIPFTQLRFNPEDDLTWGLNVQRFRPTINEEDTWVLIPRTVRAWASRFGELQGVSDVRPARRIELLPYVAATSTLYGDAAGDNPFRQGANAGGRVGADAKIGIGPNLTLDATINPDFGQVEADPAEVNLTAFETRFTERRPFFLEGSPLFNIGHPNFYYSRRVGTRPIGPATADYVEYPPFASILGAAKLTGRLPSKTSIGFLAAATAEESADIADAALGEERSVRVAPRAYYGVGRVLQEFGTNASTAGLFASLVHRDFQDVDPLADLYSRNAAAFAGNTLLRFKGGQYEFRAAGGGSVVTGTEAAMTRVQRSSAHFAQRPDRDYAVLDPTLTSLPGWTAAGGLQSNRRPPLAVGRQHQGRLGELRDQRLRRAERRRRPADLGQPHLPRNAARPAVPRLRVHAERLERFDAAPAPAGGHGARADEPDVGELLDHQRVGDAQPAADERHAHPRRPADGARARMDHAGRRRQSRRVADPPHRQRHRGQQRRRRVDPANHGLGVVPARPPLAVLGRAVLRPRHRAAAVRHHAARRPRRDLRLALRLRRSSTAARCPPSSAWASP